MSKKWENQQLWHSCSHANNEKIAHLSCRAHGTPQKQLNGRIIGSILIRNMIFCAELLLRKRSQEMSWMMLCLNARIIYYAISARSWSGITLSLWPTRLNYRHFSVRRKWVARPFWYLDILLAFLIVYSVNTFGYELDSQTVGKNFIAVTL